MNDRYRIRGNNGTDLYVYFEQDGPEADTASVETTVQAFSNGEVYDAADAYEDQIISGLALLSDHGTGIF